MTKSAALFAFTLTSLSAWASPITVRTEMFPRPPYSGATYYIYEQDNQVICTKLEVCNKFNDCETSYYKGKFEDSEDLQTGTPFDVTAAQVIPEDKLVKHRCLTKFSLVR